MGTYDTFFDTHGHEHQTKAFGKNLRVYRPGDPVRVRRAPFNGSEFDAWLAGEWDEDPGPGADTCQVQAGDGYVNIREGHYVGVTPDRDPNLPLFDYFGRNITDLEARLTDPQFVTDREQVATLAHYAGHAARAATLPPAARARDIGDAIRSLVSYMGEYLVDPRDGFPLPPETGEPVPMTTLPEIADLFLTVLEPLRGVEDPMSLLYPERANHPYERLRHTKSGEDLYTMVTTSLRRVGLLDNTPGPGWASQATVLTS